MEVRVATEDNIRPSKEVIELHLLGSPRLAIIVHTTTPKGTRGLSIITLNSNIMENEKVKNAIPGTRHLYTVVVTSSSSSGRNLPFHA